MHFRRHSLLDGQFRFDVLWGGESLPVQRAEPRNLID